MDPQLTHGHAALTWARSSHGPVALTWARSSLTHTLLSHGPAALVALCTHGSHIVASQQNELHEGVYCPGFVALY